MNNFNYYNPCRIIFGKDTEMDVATHIKSFNVKKVLLHYGGSSIKKNGVYDRVIKSLKDGNISYVELGNVKPNPRLDLALEGIDICKKEGVDFILAVGGGSVIDSAKAIAAGTYHDDIWSYYMDNSKPIENALPIGVILTIPAAGSESSTGSVITNEKGSLKRYINSEKLIPQFAIMNPEITYSMPKEQIVYGASDIIAHLMERYFTQIKNVDLSDRFLESAFKTMIRYTPIAIENPKCYTARSEIMWAGTLAHNGLLGMGRDEDWSSHNIEHELSGEYDIPHGMGLSIIFPAWMKYVYKDNVDKFAQFANRIFGIDYANEEKENQALEGIRQLELFYRSVGLPTRLSHENINTDRFEVMAKRVFEGRGDAIGSFKKLKVNDIVKIYELSK